MPCDSISAAGALHTRENPCSHGSSSNRQSSTRSFTPRQRSESSALDFRSRSTPDTYLELPTPPPNSKRGRLATQSTGPKSSWQPERPLDPRRASSCVPSWTSRRSSLDDTATFRGKKYRPATETADSKICLHTHHHHYWIVSEPDRMQHIAPKLRFSKKRVAIRQIDENSGFDRTMRSWPSEGRVEVLAEAGRPPSRNTNQRYLVAG